MTNPTIILKAYKAAVASLDGMNAYDVADVVDIGKPQPGKDDPTPAYELMLGVRNSAIEIIDYATDGGLKETDDRSIERDREEWNDHDTPVMTETIWSVFVELDLYSTGHAEETHGLTTDNAQYVISCVVDDILRTLIELAMEEYNTVLHEEDDDDNG